MASAALFDLLPDFGTAMPAAVPPAARRDTAPQAVSQPIDVGAAVAKAVAEAEAALEERLALVHAAAMEAERQKNAEEMQVLLASLGDDVGTTVAARIDAMEEHVTELVGSSVTRIVGNLLGEDLRKRSLAALARSIRESIGDSETVRIGVRGPQSMFEPLLQALGPHGRQLDFVEAATFDLTVAIDDTVLETRMAEWAGVLAEVLP